MQPGQRTVALGDMIVPVATVQRWRNALANGPEAAPASTTQTGVKLWTSGNVYYLFNPATGSTVSAVHQADFIAATAEWAMFANLHFMPRTTQANYILVSDGGTGEAGGNSAVGMINGAQPLNVGTTSWNRATLTHMRLAMPSGSCMNISARTATATSTFSRPTSKACAESNFTKIPNSIQNGPYDFLSVMHYSRNAFSTAPATLDTIEPLAADAQYLNVMGLSLDRVLSRGDRDGMAIMYSAGPALSSTVTNTLDTGVGSLRAALYFAFDYRNRSSRNADDDQLQDPGHRPRICQWRLHHQGHCPTPRARPRHDDRWRRRKSRFTGNTNPNGPVIALDGSLAQPPDTYAAGLRLVETGCVVKDVAIGCFSQQGVLITGAGATGEYRFSGCYLGAAASERPQPITNAYAGVEINSGATGNTVGGTTVAARNVISGNTSQGLYLHDGGTGGNIVAGNYIGLNAAGSGALPNGYAGIEIDLGAQGNTIGGGAPSCRQRDFGEHLFRRGHP